MHLIRKRRLQLIVFIIVGIACAASLALYALKQNINLFYTPTEVSAGAAPFNHRFRLGGMVKTNSVQRDAHSLLVSFVVTDLTHETKVNYTGVLPDLFREGKGVVAEGQLNNQGIFLASQVLAKHDENYMPPQVKSALKNTTY